MPCCRYRLGFRDNYIADGWLYIVDLELRGQSITAERQAARECQGVVRQVTDDASVEEPVLLLKFSTVSDRDSCRRRRYIHKYCTK